LPGIFLSSWPDERKETIPSIGPIIIRGRALVYPKGVFCALLRCLRADRVIFFFDFLCRTTACSENSICGGLLRLVPSDVCHPRDSWLPLCGIAARGYPAKIITTLQLWPLVYKACIPSTSESSTPSRRPLTPVFRYAPEIGNWRGLSNCWGFAATSHGFTVSRVLMIANQPENSRLSYIRFLIHQTSFWPQIRKIL
jgi:hypothetical protein